MTDQTPRLPEVTNEAALLVWTAGVDRWMTGVHETAPLLHAHAQARAIIVYFDRKPVPGARHVHATARRLEMRIGELLGPARPRGGHQRSNDGMTSAERSTYRLFHAHRDVVERVIAESTDSRPASQRRLRAAIDEATGKDLEAASRRRRAKLQRVADRRAQVRRMYQEDGLSVAEIAEMLALTSSVISEDLSWMGITRKRTKAAGQHRVKVVTEMAAQGSTRAAMADELGVSRETISKLVKTHGIDVPADRAVHKTRALDATRFIDTTVSRLEDLADSLSALDGIWDSANDARMPEWASRAEEALRTLNRFARQLKGTTPNYQRSTNHD